MKTPLALLVLPLFLAACTSMPPTRYADFKLEEVAASPRQWTGVAVSRAGRLFVNYPRWSDDVPVSVAELRNGQAVPYPDEAWNQWEDGDEPSDRFVCVQSVVADAKNRLWILDPANPKFAGVVEGGAKLVQVDLASNEVVRVFRFGTDVAPRGSYLNDVRVDTVREFAYISDSGLGAMVVVDLRTGASWRRLVTHPSTKAEQDVDPMVEGHLLRFPDGAKPVVHCDGIALDGDGEYLYYQALTGRSLYRIRTAHLRARDLTETELWQRRAVEYQGESGVADGLEWGPDGSIYITALEASAIKRMTWRNRLETVVQDARLAWPDSLAWGPDGSLYVTTSLIHRWSAPGEPYRIFKVVPALRDPPAEPTARSRLGVSFGVGVGL